MSSLSPVGRSAAARKNDRVSLCSFTFADGRRCRTPRNRNHPHFCFYHAQKEARARAAETLGKDLAYFFSGNYLSACDLSTALAHLIPAVVRGDVKSKTAHTVAYLMQTLLQAIHISEQEYTNAFGDDGWRKSIRNSVNGNHKYLFPPAPQPAPSALRTDQRDESPQPQPAAVAHPLRGEASHPAQPQPPQPAPSPHTPLPLTSTEFVQHVVAGLQTGSLPATPHLQPAPPNPQPASTPPQPAAVTDPAPVAHPLRGEAFRPAPPPQTQAQQPASALQAPAAHPILPTQPARSVAPAAQPNNPPPTASPAPKPVQ